MTPGSAKVLAAIVTIYGNRLDATYLSIRQKLRAQDWALKDPLHELAREGLIQIVEKQRDGTNVYRPTAAGWAAAGIKPPMGLEPVHG